MEVQGHAYGTPFPVAVMAAQHDDVFMAFYFFVKNVRISPGEALAKFCFLHVKPFEAFEEQVGKVPVVLAANQVYFFGRFAGERAMKILRHNLLTVARNVIKNQEEYIGKAIDHRKRQLAENSGGDYDDPVEHGLQLKTTNIQT